MAVPVTKPMRDALHIMKHAPGTRDIKFQTGEALRKRGLAWRRTLFVSLSEVFSQRGATHERARYDIHEWHLTPAGTKFNATRKIP